MKLKELGELQANKALSIKYTEGSDIATLYNVEITLEQAEALIKKMGWVEHRLNAFEIISKTNSFVKAFKKGMGENEDLWNNTEVQFQNIRSNTYGKTFDRICLFHPMRYNLALLCGMENVGAKYALYEVGRAIPIEKSRTLAKIAEFIDTKYSNVNNLIF